MAGLPEHHDVNALSTRESTSILTASELLGLEDAQSTTSSQHGLQPQTAEEEQTVLTSSPIKGKTTFLGTGEVSVDKEIDGEGFEEKEISIEEWLKSGSDQKLWSAEHGFNISVLKNNPKKAEEYLLEYLLKANKEHTVGNSMKFCVKCGRKKGDDGPNSHIWPNSVLKCVQQRNFGDAQDFMFDVTRCKRFRAKNLTAKLLCKKCEVDDSDFEESLCHLYLKLMLRKGSYELTVDNKDNWLQYALVKVLFLGMMINIDVKQECLTKVFMDLWTYYMRMRPIDKLAGLRLFLLPSDAFCPTSKFTYILENMIRNPAFTTLVENEEGKFLYAQCDVFHLVLLVDDSTLFEKHNNCFAASESTTLAICGNISSGYKKKQASITHGHATNFSLDSENTDHLFPFVLAKENIDRIPECLFKSCFEPIKKNRQKNKEATIRFFHTELQYPYELPIQDQATDPTVTRGESFDPKKPPANFQKKCLVKGRELSPLWPHRNEIELWQRKLAKLEKHVAELEKQNADLKASNAQFQVESEKSTAEIEKQNADLKASNAQLQVESEKSTAELEKQNADLKASNAQLQLEWEMSTAELKEENADLKASNAQLLKLQMLIAELLEEDDPDVNVSRSMYILS